MELKNKRLFNPSHSGAESRGYSARAPLIQSDSIPCAALHRGWETLIRQNFIARSCDHTSGSTRGLNHLQAALLLPFVPQDPLQPPHIWLFRFHLRGLSRFSPGLSTPPPSSVKLGPLPRLCEVTSTGRSWKWNKILIKSPNNGTKDRPCISWEFTATLMDY